MGTLYLIQNIGQNSLIPQIQKRKIISEEVRKNEKILNFLFRHVFGQLC